MEFPKDKRVVIGIGAGAAVLGGVLIAVLAMGGRDKTPEPPPAAKGGLEISVSETPNIDPSRQLRCFVNGQFVGMATLAECARRNGVATQALDVGLDETGNLVAAETASLAPPPVAPPPAEIAPSPEPAVDPGLPSSGPEAPVADAGPGAACLRHLGGEWRQLSDNLSLNACVQLLFAGRCERPGAAAYGRWGDTTLRLVPGRVEQQGPGGDFRTLVEQGRGCSLPPVR
ncbi:MAG TPA: hypothetical protein VD929_00470 [Caulobacteraceae bacterium]|nr:hypothetical protein [Caulobacteraceae bacterium]